MPSSLSAPIYTDVRSYLGDAQVPSDIKRMRQSTLETMQRMGTPVLLKRMYTIADVDAGNAQRSPGWDDTYKQVRHNDPLSNGVGFCSIDTQQGEWYDPQTLQVFAGDIDANNPGANSPDGLFLPAPRYRGYGPGFLTYVILPDRPEDVFKLNPQGVLTQAQSAKIQLPWWPLVGDNDLMITVSLDDAGWIAETYERYQLKMVTPITMRGSDNRGRREFNTSSGGGNRYWIGQECEAVELPPYESAYNVEADR